MYKTSATFVYNFGMTFMYSDFCVQRHLCTGFIAIKMGNIK